MKVLGESGAAWDPLVVLADLVGRLAGLRVRDVALVIAS